MNENLRNINIQITIYTRVNICCLTHTLVLRKNIIAQETMTITRPSNESLILKGFTKIKTTKSTLK